MKMTRLDIVLLPLGLYLVGLYFLVLLGPAIESITSGLFYIGGVFICIMLLELAARRFYKLMGVFASWGAVLTAIYVLLRVHPDPLNLVTNPALPAWSTLVMMYGVMDVIIIGFCLVAPFLAYKRPQHHRKIDVIGFLLPGFVFLYLAIDLSRIVRTFSILNSPTSNWRFRLDYLLSYTERSEYSNLYIVHISEAIVVFAIGCLVVMAHHVDHCSMRRWIIQYSVTLALAAAFILAHSLEFIPAAFAAMVLFLVFKWMVHGYVEHVGYYR